MLVFSSEETYHCFKLLIFFLHDNVINESCARPLYLVRADAVARLGQFDRRGALRHCPIFLTLFLGVILRAAGDLLLAGRRRSAGRRLPLQHRLLLTGLTVERPDQTRETRSAPHPHTHKTLRAALNCKNTAINGNKSTLTYWTIRARVISLIKTKTITNTFYINYINNE